MIAVELENTGLVIVPAGQSSVSCDVVMCYYTDTIIAAYFRKYFRLKRFKLCKYLSQSLKFCKNNKTKYCRSRIVLHPSNVTSVLRYFGPTRTWFSELQAAVGPMSMSDTQLS